VAKCNPSTDSALIGQQALAKDSNSTQTTRSSATKRQRKLAIAAKALPTNETWMQKSATPPTLTVPSQSNIKPPKEKRAFSPLFLKAVNDAAKIRPGGRKGKPGKKTNDAKAKTENKEGPKSSTLSPAKTDQDTSKKETIDKRTKRKRKRPSSAESTNIPKTAVSPPHAAAAAATTTVKQKPTLLKLPTPPPLRHPRSSLIGSIPGQSKREEVKKLSPQHPTSETLCKKSKTGKEELDVIPSYITTSFPCVERKKESVIHVIKQPIKFGRVRTPRKVADNRFSCLLPQADFNHQFQPFVPINISTGLRFDLQKVENSTLMIELAPPFPSMGLLLMSPQFVDRSNQPKKRSLYLSLVNISDKPIVVKPEAHLYDVLILSHPPHLIMVEQTGFNRVV
jgi:hypothetical protein